MRNLYTYGLLSARCITRPDLADSDLALACASSGVLKVTRTPLVVR